MATSSRYFVISIAFVSLSGCGPPWVLFFGPFNAGPIKPCPELNQSHIVASNVAPRGEDSRKVIIADVIGARLKDVHPIGASQFEADCWVRFGFQSKVFQDALQTSLESANLIVKPESTRAPAFALDVLILEQTLQQFSIFSSSDFAITARLVVKYSLKNIKTDEPIWSKNITTEHGVKRSEHVSLFGTLLAAIEPAIKLNIEAFIGELNSLKEMGEADYSRLGIGARHAYWRVQMNCCRDP